MDYEELLKLVRNRRSIRSFKSEPVPDEYIDKIIEAAHWAPSGANSQPWEFIIVKKKEIKDSIVKICEESYSLFHRMELTRKPEQRFPGMAEPPQPPSFANAPVFIIVCGDPRTKNAYPLRSTIQQGQSILTSSLASACLYIHLAATTLGLGSQWEDAVGNPFEQSLLKKLLGIPKELEIYTMVVVGYPASEPKPRLVRAKEEMVHYDHYDKSKSRTDKEVEDFILTVLQDYTKQL